jgi:endonuclease-3
MMTNHQIGKVLDAIDNMSTQWLLPVVSLVAEEGLNPFKVLISTILSLRTKDAVTSEATQRLWKLARTPVEMSQLEPTVIEKAIYPVAFYRNKARTIIECSRRLVIEFESRVPDDLDTLLTFKGVGRKTANLVLVLGYRIPAMCVDTHVHRISNRLGYIRTKNPDESEMELRKKLPKQYWMRYNDLLVAFGQNHCKPISPLCSSCPVEKLCPKIGVRHRR